MGKNIKLPLKAGFTALCAHIKAIKETAEQSGSAVADLAANMAASLEEIDNLFDTKQDKSGAVSITIPATGWVSESTSDDAEEVDNSSYPFYYDLPVDGVTAKDRVDISIAPTSLEAATGCGFCPTTETLAGKVRLRAVSQPSVALTAEYWLHSGKE